MSNCAKCRPGDGLIIYCVLALSILSGAQLRAQPAEFINLEIFNPRSGLSSGIATSIIQDKKGFMWFGTINGLNRFDGYRFTVHRNDPTNAASIAENYVTALFEDSRGRMFVGTANGGLDLFDRVQQKFLHYGDVNLTTVTRSIIEDKTGTIWAASGNKISRFTNTGLVPVHITGLVPKGFDKSNPSITCGGDGNIYVFCQRSICRLRHLQANEYALQEVISTAQDEDLSLAGLVQDSARGGVLFIHAYGVTAYSDYTFTSSRPIVQEMIFNDCWSLDKKGNIWYLGKDGLTRTAPDGATTIIHPVDPALSNFLNTKSIMCWDQNQNLWLGTIGYGIARYSPRSNRFHTILRGKSIHDMHGGNSNTLYVGQEYQVVINKDQAVVTPLKIEESNSSAASGDNTLWTLFSKEVIRTDVRSGRKKRYPVSDAVLSPNKSGTINFDAGGKLWMAFWLCPYLACFDTATQQFSTFHFPANRTYSLYNYVKMMVWDSNGILWIYTEEGLFSFKKSTAAWGYFPIGIKKGNSVNAPVIAICNDPYQPERYLWMGTNGDGLWKMDKRTGAYTSYDLRQYIPDNSVYGILADDSGYLWLSSGHGIARFNPANSKTYTYDKSDGLQDDEFNWTAAVKLSNGTLALGGLYGINYFNPADVHPLPPPKVTLVGFRLFDKPVYPGDSSGVLKQDISFTTGLQLKYRQNVFTIESSALEYYKSAGVKYRYWLKGFDKGWVYAGTENRVTYTNLDAGTYHFFVSASYSGTDWSSEAELLTITIIPPWWKTWWFYSLVAVFAGLVIYLIYRYRLRQLLEVERLRLRIAQDLHDEIGSTLSTLSIYSKILQDELPPENEHAAILLNSISQNANDAMVSVSDIVWSINTRYDGFKSITNRMREHAFTVFDARDCRLHYGFDESLTGLALPMDQRKDLYLIFKEALNNVSKYAGCANVWISLRRTTGGGIELIVRDDGAGFEQSAESSGNGIQNMRDRAASLQGELAVTSAPGQGTTVRLLF